MVAAVGSPRRRRTIHRQLVVARRERGRHGTGVHVLLGRVTRQTTDPLRKPPLDTLEGAHLARRNLRVATGALIVTQVHLAMLLCVRPRLHMRRVDLACMGLLLRAAIVTLVIRHEVALRALEQWLTFEQEKLGGASLVPVRVGMLLQVRLPLQGLRAENAASVHRVARFLVTLKETSLLRHREQRGRCGNSAEDYLGHGCGQLLLSCSHHESLTVRCHILFVLPRCLARLDHLLFVGLLDLHVRAARDEFLARLH